MSKDRRPFLQNESLRTEVFKMLTHHVKESGCISASVGGHVDHVHLLIGLSRTITIEKLVEEIKKETSKWIKSHPRGTQLFQWQAGYGVFSVSHSMLDVVDEYTRSQNSQLEKRTFQHGIEFDERYVWD